jgi:hypothetical protein
VKTLLTVSDRGSLHEEGAGCGGSSASRRRSWSGDAHNHKYFLLCVKY